MGSAWVEHVKSVYAKGKKKGMSYKEAMQKAKVSWAKKKGGAAAKAPAKKGKKKKAAEETDEKAEVAEKKPKRQKKKSRPRPRGPRVHGRAPVLKKGPFIAGEPEG